MSETPRTDELWNNFEETLDVTSMLNLCRQLERELAEANRSIDALQREVRSEHALRTAAQRPSGPTPDKFKSIEELIAEYERDPVKKELLDKARVEMAERLSSTATTPHGPIEAIERAFQMLALHGVPQDRAKTVANGIDVLATRFQKEIAALSARATTTVCYETCEKHRGFPWTMAVPYVQAAQIKKVCPICEPPNGVAPDDRASKA